MQFYRICLSIALGQGIALCKYIRSKLRRPHWHNDGQWPRMPPRSRFVGSTIPGTDVADVNGLQSALDSKAPKDSPTVTDTVSGIYIYMRMVGLGNVDHTADARKPVSSATQHALALKAPRQRARHSWAPYRVYLRELLASATSITPPTQSSPYPRPRRPPLIQKTPINSPTFSGAVSGVSKAMVQLRTVNNTTDATKPVSAATQTGLDLNADNTTTHTKTDVEQHISNLIASAPDALNTLNELALAFCTQP